MQIVKTWFSLPHNYKKNLSTGAWNFLHPLLMFLTGLSRRSGTGKSFSLGGGTTGKPSSFTPESGGKRVTTATTTRTVLDKHSETATRSVLCRLHHRRQRAWQSFVCGLPRWGFPPEGFTPAILFELNAGGLLSSLRTAQRLFCLLTPILLFALSSSGCETIPQFPPPMEDL